MKTEPVLATLTGFAVAVIGLLAAFGLDFTTEQSGAIVGFVAALYGVGVVIRSKVTPVGRRR